MTKLQTTIVVMLRALNCGCAAIALCSAHRSTEPQSTTWTSLRVLLLVALSSVPVAVPAADPASAITQAKQIRPGREQENRPVLTVEPSIQSP